MLKGQGICDIWCDYLDVWMRGWADEPGVAPTDSWTIRDGDNLITGLITGLAQVVDHNGTHDGTYATM